MKLSRFLLLATLLASLLAACGQKGPLFLPDDKAPPTSESPEEEEDDET